MRKFLTVTGVLVVLLGGLLVVADRVGVNLAEKEIAKRISARLSANGITSSTPDVDITGVPFLTQVLRGEYEEIDLTLRDLTGGKVPLPLLTVQAKGVRAPLSGLRDGTAEATAAKVTGTGTVAYTSLVQAGNLPGLTLHGDGGRVLSISGKVAVLGELKGRAEVTVVDGKVRLRVIELNSASGALTNAAQMLLTTYRNRMAVTLPLPALPFGLVLKDVQTAETGLLVTMTANEVNLT